MRVRNKVLYARFAKLLRESRESRQMTQGELAMRLGLGQQAVSRWERGLSRPQTPGQVAAVARLFQEHDRDCWIEASGHRKRAASSKRKAGVKIPVRPLLDVLPFDELTAEQFQEFGARFVEACHPGATVSQFGVSGDTQDGVDIDAYLNSGRYYTYQSKRESEFGAAKVLKAVQAHKKRSHLAHILLSRIATAQARAALPAQYRGQKWKLLDGRDISRMIQNKLPLAVSLRLIDAFFRRYRQDFLGVDEPGAFESPEEYFAPFLRRDIPFSHVWTLVGRTKELASLTQSLDRSAPEVTLLVGPGGVGKTRLMREATNLFARSHPDRHIAVLPSSREPSAQELERIGARPHLLIIEDAHERADLRALFHAVIRFRTPARLLITTRPYGKQIVRGEAAVEGNIIADDAVIELKGLSIDRAEEVALEILKAKMGPIEAARHIAVVTHDSPFALVVGSHLVATQAIHPDTLNNVDEFRDQLMARFKDAITGTIGQPADREIFRDMLNLVALVRPVDPASSSFQQLAAQMVHPRSDRVQRAFHLLKDAGVFIKRGHRYRIAPDLLADHVLETCCVPNSEGSLGYAERALEHADASAISNIVVNVSNLDWRLSASDRTASTVIDAVWKYIEGQFAADLSAHPAVLEGVTTAAYYQPRHAIAFYDRARDASEAKESFARLLRNASMSGEHVEEACARLWELGKNDARQLNQHPNHPIRLLRELVAIEPRKPIEFSERIVNFAIQRLSANEPHSAPTAYTLFEILESVLASEGHTTTSRGHSLIISKFLVRRAAVAGLRQRVIQFLLETLREAHIPAATRALKCVEEGLRFPMDGDSAAHAEWAAEFCETMQWLQAVITSTPLDGVLLVAVVKTVAWHAGYAGAPTGAPARSLLAAIPQTLEYKVSLALIDGWGRLVRERRKDLVDASNHWNHEMQQIATALVAAFTDFTGVVEFLQTRLAAIEAQQDDQASPSTFISILTDARPELAAALCNTVLQSPAGALRLAFGQALYQLSKRNPQRALEYAERTLKLDIPALRRDVAWAYGSRLRSNDVLQEERLLAERLLHDADESIVLHIASGISGQASVDRTWTLTMLLNAPIDRSRRVADEVFSAFSRSGDIAIEKLDGHTLMAFLDRLQQYSTLDGYPVQEFLKHAARREPAAMIEFYIKRLENEPQRADDIRFRPLPYFVTPLVRPDFRSSPHFTRHLKRVREWLLRAENGLYMTMYGPKLYAMVAGELDELILSDLEPWIQSGAPDKIALAARILGEARPSFVFDHRHFVIDLLERAAAAGEQCLRSARSSLFALGASGLREGPPGQPFPQDVERRDRACEALEATSRGSPAWSLYNSLKRDAELDIHAKHEDDEAFLEE